jgi:hypothetical protein
LLSLTVMVVELVVEELELQELEHLLVQEMPQE